MRRNVTIRSGPAEHVKMRRNRMWILFSANVGLGLMLLDTVLPSKVAVLVNFIIVIHLMIARAYFSSDRRSDPK